MERLDFARDTPYLDSIFLHSSPKHNVSLLLSSVSEIITFLTKFQKILQTLNSLYF